MKIESLVASGTKVPRCFRSLLLAFVVVATLLHAVPASSLAAEPYLKFLDGLRSRQYYDTALSYLDTLQQRSDVPADIKQIVPYEKAVTLVQGAQFVQNPEMQGKQLDQAQAYLETFLKDSPNHELAPVANTELARIMLGKAQVLTWRSRSPSNEENRTKFQADARQLIQKARGIFSKALAEYKKEWESYGVFIPEDQLKERAARSKAEGLYMRAQLDLATCTYEEAQTYDQGSDDFNKLLRQASLEFEDVHSKYRSQYAGLFARTMQGKCFEEQDTKDDIRKAMGIYDELLSHPGRSSGLKKLQHQVRHFRLICLNHETRKDYQLVIQEASEWLTLNRAISRSQTGLGIRWELAQAQESLALERTTPEADRTRLLRQALDNAREINKYAGPYKDVSNSMIQRVLVAMDREPGDPEDFDTAFGTANNMLEQIGELRDNVKKLKASGKKQEVTNAEAELQALLSETERMYRLALALALPETPGAQINAARYRLAYMFYLQRQSYETAVVGQYLSIRARESDPGMALDGAYLAMAGYSQAFNDASDEAKDNLLSLTVQVCEDIATTWPDSDRATDARLEMGRIYRRSKQPLEAAKWYSQVPETVPQYATSQIEAGQAYWNAYLVAVTAEQTQATTEELTSWQDSAAKYLLNGIQKKQQEVPASEPTPAEITRAKVSLAQIEIMRGNEKKAVELLTTEPHSVVKAISVAAGEARPKQDSDVKSTTFASFAYQQLLRAYIGTRQLEEAEQARAELEKVAGASGGEALTAVYVELGRELQNELERLKKLGDQKRIDDVRGGFESFLNQLFSRKDGQTYGSLIWIAETYFGLAESSSESPQKAKTYYDSAAKTYEEILKRSASNPNFIDANRALGVKLRLVNCKRQQGEYEAGETIVKQILADSPRALDAQIEAAALYQSWGQQDDLNQLLLAVKGNTFDDGTMIWGWGNIAKRLQMLLNEGQATPEYKERSREASYRLAQSRLQYAEKSSDLNSSDEQLKRAKFELVAFTSVTPDLPETDWWPKYDELYQEIQRNLGEAAVPLPKPEPLELVAVNDGSSNFNSPDLETIQPEPESPIMQAEPESNMLSMILFGILLLGGLGGGGYMILGASKSKKKPSVADRFAADEPAMDFSAAIATAAPAAKPKRAATSPSKTKAAASEAEKKRVRSKSSSAASGDAKRPEQRRSRSSSSSSAGEKKRVRKKPPEQS